MRDDERLIAFVLARAAVPRGRVTWRTVHHDARGRAESFRVDGVNAGRMVAVIVAPQQQGREARDSRPGSSG